MSRDRKEDEQPKYLQKRIEHPMENYTNEFLKRFKRSIVDSELFQNISELINRSDDRNTLKFNFLSKPYDMTYNDRKYLVYGLTISSMLLHSMRYKFRLRTLIPYYIMWSGLFCHENLNPYI
jgi:hypothetical protein